MVVLSDLDISLSWWAELSVQPVWGSEELCPSILVARGDAWHVLRVGPSEWEREGRRRGGTSQPNEHHTVALLSHDSGFKFWAPATYLLVTFGGQFTSPGLSVPFCTVETRLGILDEVVEVQGL